MSVAIVLSTYNGIKYLEEQLDSIRRQTLKPDRVYISDDCSTDDTVKYIKDYICKNGLESWSLSVNETNRGWKANFHQLLKNASEDYIFLADQDDIWIEQKLAKMMAVMKENNSMDLLACGYEPFYSDSTEKISKTIRNTINNTKSVVKIQMNGTFHHVLRPGCTFLVKKSFVREIEPYWDESIAHDANLWRFSVLKGTAYLLDEVLIKWRRYSASSSTLSVKHSAYKNWFKMKYKAQIATIESHLNCYRHLLDYASAHNCNDKNRKVVLDTVQFEKEYLEALKNRSVSGLLKMWTNKREFLLSRKQIIGSILFALFG